MNHELTDWTTQRLIALGWDAARADLNQALASYCEFFGLSGFGIGQAVVESLSEKRFCAHPDHMEARSSLCKWNKRDVGVFLNGTFPGLTSAQSREVAQQVCDATNSVCGLRLFVVQRQSDINAAFGPIDGRNGTLAWSELPCPGDDRPLRQKYDTAESWAVNRLAFKTMLHEVGHGVGLPHIPPSQGRAVMNPTLQEFDGWMEIDKRELVQRYGAPQPAPQPQPTPQPDGAPKVLVFSLDVVNAELAKQGLRLVPLEPQS